MATNPSTLTENIGRITAPDADYPYGSAQDDSTGTTGDGTPIKKAILNDTYGFFQWLLTEASIVPSGNAETVLASDLGDALNILFLNLSNLASSVEAEAGTNNTNWMSPLRTRQSFRQFGLGDGVEVNTPYDADVFDIDFTGFLKVVSTATNLPVATNGFIESYFRSSVNMVLIYTPDSNTDVSRYINVQNSGTWTGWVQLAPMGEGQTWQDVLGSRSQGVTYTNTTGRPIQVSISLESGESANTSDFLIDSITVDNHSFAATAIAKTLNHIIPNGSTYRLNTTGSTAINDWGELR